VLATLLALGAARNKLNSLPKAGLIKTRAQCSCIPRIGLGADLAVATYVK